MQIKRGDIGYINLYLCKFTGNVIKVKRHFWYEKNQFYVMEATQNLTSGIYLIEMEFIGKLDNDLVGLYRSTYKNQNNNEMYENPLHSI